MKKISFLFVLITIAFSSCKKSDDPAPDSGRPWRVFAAPEEITTRHISVPFKRPQDIAFDGSGNLYVTDFDEYGSAVIKISTDSSVSVIYYTSSFNLAPYINSLGITADASGNVYIADQSAHVIRKITSDSVVTTIAGSGNAGFQNGNGTAASFNTPTDLVLDAEGNLYVTDMNNSVIRKITPSGDVSTYAGSGMIGSLDSTLAEATFSIPYGIAIDNAGTLYITDNGDAYVRKITASAVSTVIGKHTPGIDTTFVPRAIAVDATGNLYVSDIYNWLIYKIDVHAQRSVFFGNKRGINHIIISEECYGIAIKDNYVFSSDALLKYIARIQK